MTWSTYMQPIALSMSKSFAPVALSYTTTTTPFIMQHLAPGHLIQKGRFRHMTRSLFGANVLLYEQVLMLKGWGWGGLYKRTYPLTDIIDIEWWEGKNGCNFAIKLKDGKRVPLWIRGAGRWKYEIEEQRRIVLKNAEQVEEAFA